MSKSVKLYLKPIRIGEFAMGRMDGYYYVNNGKVLYKLESKNIDEAKKEAHKKIVKYCLENKLLPPKLEH